MSSWFSPKLKPSFAWSRRLIRNSATLRPSQKSGKNKGFLWSLSRPYKHSSINFNLNNFLFQFDISYSIRNWIVGEWWWAVSFSKETLRGASETYHGDSALRREWRRLGSSNHKASDGSNQSKAGQGPWNFKNAQVPWWGSHNYACTRSTRSSECK